MEETTFTESSGNIYADLGLEDPEGMLAKAGCDHCLRRRSFFPSVGPE